MIIYYKISNLNIYNSLKINSYIFNDIIKVIANALNISDQNLILIEPYPQKIDFGEFNFIIQSFSNSINFIFPNKTIVVKNFNQLKTDQILNCLKNEGIYIDNIMKCFPFKIVGKLRNDFDVLFDFKSDRIMIEFDSKIFIFTEFEEACNAYKILKSIYRNHGQISIIEDNKKELSQNDFFDKTKKYSIKVTGLSKQSKQLYDYPKPQTKPLLYSNDQNFDFKKTQINEQKKSIEPKNDQKSFKKEFIKEDEKNHKKPSIYSIMTENQKIDAKTSNSLYEKHQHENEEKNQNAEILPKPLKNISDTKKLDIDSKQQKNKKNSEFHEKGLNLDENKKEESHITKPKPKLVKPTCTDLTSSNSDDIQKVDEDEIKIEEEIPVIFIIEGTQNGKKFYPLRKTLNKDTKIKDVKTLVSNARKIEGEFAICYKENDVKIRIHQEMTIDDVRDEMNVIENGKSRNYLYIEFIQPKQKVTQSQFKPKKSCENSNKDSENEIDTATILKKNKQEKLKEKSKTKIKKSSSDDDDDINDDDQIYKEKKNRKENEDQNHTKNNKYLYQINNDSKVHEIELDSEATVKTMKMEIAEENDVDNINRIKIIFAGKELLDDIILEELEVGDVLLYVYIQKLEEILLLTAKALKV